jgi:hypothetical protein
MQQKKKKKRSAEAIIQRRRGELQRADRRVIESWEQ